MKGISIHMIGQAVGLHVAKKNSRNEQAEHLAYGAEILIGSILKLSVLFFIAVMTDIVLEATVLLIVTGIVRTLSGGAHCSAYYRCMVTSLLILMMFGHAINISYPFLSLLPVSVLIGIIALCICIYWRYAPQAPLNKPFMSRTKELTFRWYTLFTVVVFLIISIILGTSSLIAWTIAFALLWQAFTLTPLGHRFIGLWDVLLSPKEKGGEAKC